MENRIKEIRKYLHYTQQEFADELKIPRSTLAMYETNRAKPNFDFLIDISIKFNVSIDYLLGQSSSPEPQPELSMTLTPNTVTIVDKDKNVYLYKIPNSFVKSTCQLMESISETLMPENIKSKKDG